MCHSFLYCGILIQDSMSVTNAILLSAHRAGEKKGLLQILSVNKAVHPPLYKTAPINARMVTGTFGRQPDKLLKLLAAFSEEAQAKTTIAIKQLHNAQKNNSPYSDFQKKELAKHQYDLFKSLKPFVDSIKWYHSYATASNRMVTAPCKLQTIVPHLKFEVLATDGLPTVQPMVELNNITYPLSDFEQNSFFLRKENDYFILPFRDAQKLNWLQEQAAIYMDSKDEHLLSAILNELQEQYPVNRNAFQKTATIESTPVPVVHLSELSDAFLMLRPQWLYNGHLIEDDWQPETSVQQQETTITIKRNQEKEEALRALLESLHPKFADQRNGYYYLSFSEAQKRQWFQKAYHKLLTSNVEITGMDMLKHFRFSSYLPETTMDCVEQDAQFFSYKIVVQFGKEKVSINELQKILWAGQTAVLLKDGTLGLLNSDWMNTYATIIKHGRIQQQLLKVSKWLQLSLLADDITQTDSTFKKWWAHWSDWQANKSTYALPSSVQATLRPYQQRGYEWMCLMADAGAGGCLADDMGLGKTLQSISFLARTMEQFPGTQALVVCPASLIYNWEQELNKFAPHLKVVVYHGSQRNAALINDSATNVFITSYGTLRSEEETLGALAYKVVFIDESHNIKNPAAKITRAVGNLKADYCFALSGTPVVNNTFDLYAQLNTILPGIFGSREFFKREYADPIDRFGDEEKQQQLQKLIAPFVLRRTKEQVAPDLPEKTESILWCEMGDNQRLVYENLKEEIRGSVFSDIKEKGIGKSRLNILQGIMKLRQACNSPLLVKDAEPPCADSIKTDLLFEELEQLLFNHKVLVFSQFTGMLDLIAQSCKTKSIAYFHFNGQTPPAQRAKMVDDFQDENNQTNLFLISLKAGNAGLTLTAADYVFLFDPWWNEAVQQQAINRTHRIGQQKNVFAYKMICKNSIEEKILQLQERKQKLATDIISTDEGFIKNLDAADVEWLFG